ncbi:MAG: hypothetical protein R3C68_18915 [Myxococcota bacterium]
MDHDEMDGWSRRVTTTPARQLGLIKLGVASLKVIIDGVFTGRQLPRNQRRSKAAQLRVTHPRGSLKRPGTMLPRQTLQGIHANALHFQRQNDTFCSYSSKHLPRWGVARHAFQPTNGRLANPCEAWKPSVGCYRKWHSASVQQYVYGDRNNLLPPPTQPVNMGDGWEHNNDRSLDDWFAIKLKRCATS